MFFVEITILSMLFSHARGGGCQLGLKKICRPRAVVKIPDTPCILLNRKLSLLYFYYFLELELQYSYQINRS